MAVLPSFGARRVEGATRQDFNAEDAQLLREHMKAARLRAFRQELVVEQAPVPKPEPDEILVEVEACGVCHSDLHMASRDWPDVAARMTLPATLGHEAVGCVVEKGAGVNGVFIGARVGVGWLHSVCGRCEHCVAGAENVCLERTVTSVDAPGGYAEFMRVRASQAVPIPDGLSSAQAAPWFCAGLTVYHALQNAGVAAGQRVAIFGVGGLGHLAIQLAAGSGAEVVALDVSPAKLELARALGVKEALDGLDPDAVRRLRDGGGPHVALVTAPSKAAYDLAVKTLRRRGTLMVVGLPKEDLTFFADDLAVGEFRILGSAVGTRREMRDLLALVASGAARCQVETWHLEEVNRVFDCLRRGDILGRAVLEIKPARTGADRVVGLDPGRV
jgi:propanol-preferring alcohol dehydrogenase